MSSLLRRSAGPAVDELGETDRADLERLLAHDPIVNAVLIARLAAGGTLGGRRFGGQLMGVRGPDGELAAAAYHGGNLIPVGGGDRGDGTDASAAALAGLVHRLASGPRGCSSMVGSASAVAACWPALEPAWGAARLVRPRQPLLLLDGRPDVPPDPRVEMLAPSALESYLPAAAAMFTEELGVSPFRSEGAGLYRRRVAELLRDGRAFAIRDDHGEVVFKADLGVVTADTCQVQGVWVRPDLRGRGIGTRALATVLAHALTLAPTVSLYVNEFNTAARRMYDTLGMRQVATLTTVLF